MWCEQEKLKWPVIWLVQAIVALVDVLGGARRKPQILANNLLKVAIQAWKQRLSKINSCAQVVTIGKNMEGTEVNTPGRSVLVVE